MFNLQSFMRPLTQQPQMRSQSLGEMDAGGGYGLPGRSLHSMFQSQQFHTGGHLPAQGYMPQTGGQLPPQQFQPMTGGALQAQSGYPQGMYPMGGLASLYGFPRMA